MAEEVLALFYGCREKFQITRSPSGNSMEGKTRKRGENETPDEARILDNSYVFIERYEREKEPFIKLWALKFRFMTIFGKTAGQPFDEIRRILQTVFLAASRIGNRYWRDQGRKQFTEQEFQKHLEIMHDNEDIIWGSFDEKDKVATRIDECIFQIENYCISILKK